jgi:hypothetical protein
MPALPAAILHVIVLIPRGVKDPRIIRQRTRYYY